MSSERSPAFQFYPRDFLASTKVDLMSMAERGVYITLLARAWIDGGLPDDMRALATMARLTPKAFAKVWAGQVGQCFERRDGRYVNARLERERDAQAEFRASRQRAAEKRWSSTQHARASDVHVKPDARALHVECSASASATASATASTDVPVCVLPATETSPPADDEHTHTPTSRLAPPPPADRPPLDVWFAVLQRRYPSHRASSGYRTQQAFAAIFDADPRPAPEVWQQLRENLEHNLESHEWRIRGIVPGLEKYLRDGLWRNVWPALPPSAALSERSLRTMAGEAVFMAGGE